MLDIQSYQQKLVSLRAQTPYMLQFLFQEKADVDMQGLLALLKKHAGNVEMADVQAGVPAFAFTDHTTRFNEGMIPTQCLIAPMEEVGDVSTAIGASLDQTWDWGQAGAAVGKAKAVLTVTDLMAGNLERKSRLGLIHGIAHALLELFPSALAIHWLPSQRVIDPKAYREGMEHGGRLYSSALNVRLHRVEGMETEFIMDTMGLLSFGISDVQCHFTKQLSPWDVGMLLYNLGEFLFEKGEVINDGDTVEGVNKTDRWVCQREQALVNPHRIVIDINPGEFSPPR